MRVTIHPHPYCFPFTYITIVAVIRNRTRRKFRIDATQYRHRKCPLLMAVLFSHY